MLIVLRFFTFYRKSGYTRRRAIARAWAKWREPDPFPTNQKRRA